VRVCLVVPMYNEEVIARSSIETIQSYIRELPPVITLLVVNDASKDNTEKVGGITESCGWTNKKSGVSL